MSIKPFQQQFIRQAIDSDALCFGEFTLKSGRVSPYFFNAGRFSSGGALSALAACYADAIVDSGVQFDVLFGPAYKGFLWLQRRPVHSQSAIISTFPLPITAKKRKTMARVAPWWARRCRAVY